MTSKHDAIRSDILAALSHPEAEDGLYLNNLLVVHEEEERQPVRGTQMEVLDILREMMEEGLVTINEEGEQVIFFLAKK